MTSKDVSCSKRINHLINNLDIADLAIKMKSNLGDRFEYWQLIVTLSLTEI